MNRPKSTYSEGATTGYGLATTLRNLEDMRLEAAYTRVKAPGRSPFAAHAFPDMRLRLLTWQAEYDEWSMWSMCRCSCMEWRCAAASLQSASGGAGHGEHVPMCSCRGEA